MSKCSLDCQGCSCFQNPPCHHCTDGHGFNSFEDIENLAESIQKSLHPFLGQTCNADSYNEIKNVVIKQLEYFLDEYEGKRPPTPLVEVHTYFNNTEIDLICPANGDKITLIEWLARAEEGLYD